jgi:hypothetical protein
LVRYCTNLEGRGRADKCSMRMGAIKRISCALYEANKPSRGAHRIEFARAKSRARKVNAGYPPHQSPPLHHATRQLKRGAGQNQRECRRPPAPLPSPDSRPLGSASRARQTARVRSARASDHRRDDQAVDRRWPDGCHYPQLVCAGSLERHPPPARQRVASAAKTASTRPRRRCQSRPPSSPCRSPRRRPPDSAGPSPRNKDSNQPRRGSA